ncbi:MAG: bacillithiol biosynthesis protein BshC [Candidatus Kariarchaeaceae archaeon]
MNSTSSPKSSPVSLYDHAIQSADTSLASQFWVHLPRTLQQAVDSLPPSFPNRLSSEAVEELQLFLHQFHKRLGILTPKVEQNLDFLSNGSIVTGQQPVILGGPCLIANKIACLSSLTDIAHSSGKDLAPILFIGGYDSIQNELTNVYFPNPLTDKPVLLSANDSLNGPFPEGVAAHRVGLPSSEWIEKVSSQLIKNFNSFKPHLSASAKKIMKERLDQLLFLLNSSFFSTSSLRDFHAKIWGSLSNLISDLGIILFPASAPEVRRLSAPDYLPLLDNQQTYVRSFGQTTQKLIDLGYQPTLRTRGDKYSPFFYECPTDGFRIALDFTLENGEYRFEGTCDKCKRDYIFLTSDPLSFLSDHAPHLSARVDSAMFIYQRLLGAHLRVSGPGEINYYSQVIPALKSANLEIPTVVRYTRAYYNTPWIEKFGKILQEKGKKALPSKEFFGLLSTRAKALRSGNLDQIVLTNSAFENYLLETYQSLSSDKDKQAKMYRAWQFGGFMGRFGQETVWSWVDMALQTGLSDYLPAYKRIYSPESTFSGMAYINSLTI